MSWLRSKRFWLAVLHGGVIAGGIAASVMVPGMGTVAMAGTGLVNALLPSPMSSGGPSK
jgi:hypothetical protein